jgi:hypothetical protein
VPLSTFAAFGSPKNDPGRKVVTELGKFVVDASLHEKHIVLLERSSLAVFDEYTTARDNDVKFILFVGIFCTVCNHSTTSISIPTGKWFKRGQSLRHMLAILS